MMTSEQDKQMLITVEEIAPGMRLGLWKIEPDASLSPRQSERRAVAALTEAMLGHRNFEIAHDDNGKPLLLLPENSSSDAALQISVSHTRGYAAVVLSERQPSGVDIEYTSDRVGRIAHRFMRGDELAALPDAPQQRLNAQLTVWCAKEAAYKYYSEDKLTFEQMRVRCLSASEGVVENLKRGLSVRFRVCQTADYLLVFTLPPAVAS